MRQAYLLDKQVTSDGSAVLKVSDKAVEAGYMLLVYSMAGNHDNIAVGESVLFRMTDGANVINLYEGLPPVAGGFVSVRGPFVVFEGWWLEAYCANAANTEVMRLDVNGQLLKCGLAYAAEGV